MLRAASPASESLSQEAVDAMEACRDLFNDFDESEVERMDRCVKVVWLVGRSLCEPPPPAAPTEEKDRG